MSFLNYVFLWLLVGMLLEWPLAFWEFRQAYLPEEKNWFEFWLADVRVRPHLVFVRFVLWPMLVWWSYDPNGPHSRACQFLAHPHGLQCHSNCPTCGGGRADVALDTVIVPAPVLANEPELKLPKHVVIGVAIPGTFQIWKLDETLGVYSKSVAVTSELKGAIKICEVLNEDE